MTSSEKPTNEKRGFARWLEQFRAKQDGGQKKVWWWLIVLLLVGVALMIVSSMLEVKEVPQELRTTARGSPQLPSTSGGEPDAGSQMSFYEQQYEKKMRRILRQVIGVGEVDVFVNLDSVDEVVVEKNKQDTQQVTNEQDAKGAVRQVTELARDGEVAYTGDGGGKQPLISKRLKPRIRGVLVVATGVEQAALKKMVTEAVARALDVPTHRISVLPRKINYKE